MNENKKTEINQLEERATLEVLKEEYERAKELRKERNQFRLLLAILICLSLNAIVNILYIIITIIRLKAK